MVKCLVIACGIMRDELLRFQAKGISFIFMEQSLHRTPQKMGPLIQKEIDKADGQEWESIILGYGLCSNGILGLRSRRHSLVVPRVHDCIALFLGSHEKYIEEQRKEPGTYYLTKGWIEEGKSPLGIYQEYCQRCGPETAEWAIREELKNYTRIALVDMDNLSQLHRDYSEENARFLKLRYEEIKGSLEYFKRMLNGPWSDGFIILKPGEKVTQTLFLNFSTTPLPTFRNNFSKNGKDLAC
ncbi:MAG: DUF1638 domain-containing protein [Deltaproteobacteria bacterium]|nr:DUF1638 domain-containing protein [Deltaproteobacteria bacterium]